MTLAEMLHRIVEERGEILARANVELVVEAPGDVPIEPSEGTSASIGHLVDRAIERLSRQRDRRLRISGRACGTTAVVEIEYPVREVSAPHAPAVHDAFHSGGDYECFGLLDGRALLAGCGCGGRAYLGSATGSSVRLVVELPIPLASGS